MALEYLATFLIQDEWASAERGDGGSIEKMPCVRARGCGPTCKTPNSDEAGNALLRAAAYVREGLV